MAGRESAKLKLFMAFTGTNKDKAEYNRSDNNCVSKQDRFAVTANKHGDEVTENIDTSSVKPH